MDAARHLDLAPVDLLAKLLRQLLGDLGVRHRAVEPTGVARAGGEGQAHAADAVGERLHRHFLLGDLALLGSLALLHLLDHASRRGNRHPSRDEVVARVAWLDLLQRAGIAQLLDVLGQDDLHGGSRPPSARVPICRCQAPCSSNERGYLSLRPHLQLQFLRCQWRTDWLAATGAASVRVSARGGVRHWRCTNTVASSVYYSDDRRFWQGYVQGNGVRMMESWLILLRRRLKPLPGATTRCGG
jgi:hypothetical protein